MMHELNLSLGDKKIKNSYKLRFVAKYYAHNKEVKIPPSYRWNFAFLTVANVFLGLNWSRNIYKEPFCIRLGIIQAYLKLALQKSAGERPQKRPQNQRLSSKNIFFNQKS